MRCPSCGSDNPEGTKFCGGCGVSFPMHCLHCGFENLPSTKFCRQCGTSLKEPPAGFGPREQSAAQAFAGAPRAAVPSVAEGERRQLTVMFCDLVGSTALSEQLDPEDLREVVRAYQETCTTVIQRYDGHIAQHLGDGLLVYFGYPVAHEDEAQRAVRTGLETLAALHHLNPRLPHPLHVRIGIHTGLVVIGEIGSSAKREILALGETPNIAARLQGLAEPDTVVLSMVTQRLVHGLFACQDLGPQTLKGISTPLAVYRVVHESAAQSRFEVAVSTGLTPLDGRMAKTPYVFCYRIRNWYEYNRALINHGHLTVGFDEQAITAWRNIAPGRGPGTPRVIASYSKSRNRDGMHDGSGLGARAKASPRIRCPGSRPCSGRAALGAKPRHAIH
jgi:class 3 adenylate cyclase